MTIKKQDVKVLEVCIYTNYLQIYKPNISNDNVDLEMASISEGILGSAKMSVVVGSVVGSSVRNRSGD